MTSLSERPWRSISRTWFLRSIARSAWESARFWFWHTRQRRTSASDWTLASSTGSTATVGASPAWTSEQHAARRITVRNLRTVQLLHQRDDLFAQYAGRYRTNMFHANYPCFINYKCFRNAVDPVVDSGFPITIPYRQTIGITMFRQPGFGRLPIVLVVQSDDGNHVMPGQIEQYRVLLTTGDTPRCPDVQQPHLPPHVLRREMLIGRLQLAQTEGRRRLADERRRHLARIQAQAHRQKTNQHDEQNEGQQKSTHA